MYPKKTLEKCKNFGISTLIKNDVFQKATGSF